MKNIMFVLVVFVQTFFLRNYSKNISKIDWEMDFLDEESNKSDEISFLIAWVDFFEKKLR